MAILDDLQAFAGREKSKREPIMRNNTSYNLLVRPLSKLALTNRKVLDCLSDSAMSIST